jgi:hypothetical protein
MRSHPLLWAAVGATAIMAAALPAAAGIYQRPKVLHQDPYIGSGGPGNGPYWAGEPYNNHGIWRYGYYQGNDPDNFIRGQLMRDPTNRPYIRR